MALYCSRSRSYASSSRANPRKKNDDGVKLRAIFEQGTDEVQSAFKFAMLMHNQNLTSRRFELQAYVDVINTADAFKLSRLKRISTFRIYDLPYKSHPVSTMTVFPRAGALQNRRRSITIFTILCLLCVSQHRGRTLLENTASTNRAELIFWKSTSNTSYIEIDGASLFPQVALSCSSDRIITASTTSALCSMGIELDGGARAAVAATARSPAARAAAARVGSCSKSCCSKSSCSKSRCRKSSCSKSSCRKSSCSKSRCNHRANCQKSRSIC
ncbi:unnamed protein product [Nesidiocoris tenuis]|uniref:Uncharacterized protein n=1 Tax=Nesidiocoris tenuis TaxID=355587 RepID=A0A6H5G258_9HEMI|nr:unnamed protein product [Nesidiocoris tenuis]